MTTIEPILQLSQLINRSIVIMLPLVEKARSLAVVDGTAEN